MVLSRIFILAWIAAASALRIPFVVSRRAAVAGATAAAIGLAPANAALKPCPSGANNCWSSASTDKTKLSTWTWPSSTSRTAAMADLRAALNAYPQEGQGGVDLGGWTLVEDTPSYQRVEFRSGIGNFAKFFNGGKPFVDDLEFSIEETTVGVRSSSRVGDSDFGVNGKRLNYIAAELAKKGWDAKGVAL